MTVDINEAIKQLSENMRVALQAGEVALAARIEQKINQLIEYGTGIKS